MADFGVVAGGEGACAGGLACAGGFAPVPALEHVEGDEALPPVELTQAHGAVELEHPPVLQLPAAGEQAAHAQDRHHVVRHHHAAGLVAGHIQRELCLPARAGC